MEVTINISPTNICPYCLGSGKRKAMQSASTSNGSIRWKDIEVDYKYCNGSGEIDVKVIY